MKYMKNFFGKSIVVGCLSILFSDICAMKVSEMLHPTQTANDLYVFAKKLKFGEGVTKDLAGAAHYFKISADQGHAQAQYNYGVMLYHGYGIEQNLYAAAHYYHIAANQGFAPAQYNFAVVLANGEGVAHDLSAAKHYFQLSANQDFADAKEALKTLEQDNQ